MAEATEIPQNEIATSSFPEIRIPDNSMVTSQINISSQSIQVLHSELADHFAWIKEQVKSSDATGVMRKGALMTVNNLKPGDEQWEQIVAKGLDATYTLGRSIEEGVNSCFQRSIFFNILMEQAGLQAATMEGRWVESDRDDLKTPPERPLSMTAGGYMIAEEDQSEEHLWNLVKTGEDVFLVDSSYLMIEDGKQAPVIEKVDYKEGQRYFKVSLPSGKVRHYVVDGTVKVEPIVP
jgi:hypothetical protein